MHIPCTFATRLQPIPNFPELDTHVHVTYAQRTNTLMVWGTDAAHGLTQALLLPLLATSFQNGAVLRAPGCPGQICWRPPAPPLVSACVVLAARVCSAPRGSTGRRTPCVAHAYAAQRVHNCIHTQHTHTLTRTHTHTHTHTHTRTHARAHTS